LLLPFHPPPGWNTFPALHCCTCTGICTTCHPVPYDLLLPAWDHTHTLHRHLQCHWVWDHHACTFSTYLPPLPFSVLRCLLPANTICWDSFLTSSACSHAPPPSLCSCLPACRLRSGTLPHLLPCTCFCLPHASPPATCCCTAACTCHAGYWVLRLPYACAGTCTAPLSCLLAFLHCCCLQHYRFYAPARAASCCLTPGTLGTLQNLGFCLPGLTLFSHSSCLPPLPATAGLYYLALTPCAACIRALCRRAPPDAEQVPQTRLPPFRCAHHSYCLRGAGFCLLGMAIAAISCLPVDRCRAGRAAPRVPPRRLAPPPRRLPPRAAWWTHMPEHSAAT